jgi:uncharacterized membrane protein
MKWVLLAHVMAGATWFGGQVYVEALMASASRTGEPETIMAIRVRVGKTNSRLFSIAGILALLFGTWIVLDSLYTFEMLFVTLGFAITIIALTLEFFLLKPKGVELDAVIAEQGLLDPETMAFAKSLGNIAHVQTLLITIVMILMVLQPGV